jgi:hypothetical protein
MKRSSSTNILSTHVGSLPRPDGSDRAGGEDDSALREMVKGVVARQHDIGIDVINEGQYTKGGDWLSYVGDRFGGFVARPPAGGTPLIMQGKDREEFADFYRYAAQRGALFYEPAGQIKHSRPHWVATAPISYQGTDAVKREIEIFRSVVGLTPKRSSPPRRPPAWSPTAATNITRATKSLCSRSPRQCGPNTKQSSKRASFSRSMTPGWWLCGTVSGFRWGWKHSASTARCGSRR